MIIKEIANEYNVILPNRNMGGIRKHLTIFLDLTNLTFTFQFNQTTLKSECYFIYGLFPKFKLVTLLHNSCGDELIHIIMRRQTGTLATGQSVR
jgi:hypothetical protein